MYKILVTNDDGINAVGIRTLVRTLSQIAVVYVVAPKEQQSGKSRSFTHLTPVDVQEVDMEGAEVAYALDGTPTDCVKWALSILNERKDFDFVFSGINSGSNIGADSFYSGTVGAACEAAGCGLHAIALSVMSHEAEHFEYISSMIPELIEMSSNLGPETVLSVNCPDVSAWKIKGVKITEPAPQGFATDYVFRHNGETSYKMSVELSEIDESVDNDYNWTQKGYATITPISTALVDTVALRKLRGFMVKSAICVFLDCQNDIATCVNKPKRWEKNLAKWAKCVNRLDMPVLLAEQYGEGAIVDVLSDAFDRVERIEKQDYNAFENKDFETLISSGEEKKVYLAGLETHMSILQTAREFLRQGYEVVVIEDCCAAKSRSNHDMAINNLRAEGCKITTYEAAVMEMLGSSKHRAYKSISAILSE